MSFSDRFIQRPVLSTVVAFLILLVGAQGIFNLSVRQYPEVEETVITVTTTYPGASPDLIQGFITSPIAAAVSTTENVDYVTSQSRPSASVVTVQMQLGDVLTMRNGKTVEVMNTDAEGRLVMADALALSVEDGADAIVDVATLTGACLRTFGTEVAGVMGNDAGVVDQVRAAAGRADEPVWELPLVRSYRSQLDSTVADMTNLGGPYAGSITAGLFLEEFVDGTPWAHVDIAGTAQAEASRRWIPKGPTGFGARLLIDLILNFSRPKA